MHFLFCSDASIAGATNTPIQSHPQTPHQIGPALQMAPTGVTQYVTTIQRPQQVDDCADVVLGKFENYFKILPFQIVN